MVGLFDKINQDLIEALKAHDAIRVSTLRFLISGLKNARIDKGSDLTDDEVLDEIARDVKRHKESIEAYEKAGRNDLVVKEKTELEILLPYLPTQLSEEELSMIIDEVIFQVGSSNISDMGKVMGAVMAKVRGKADGGVVSKIVKEKLIRSN
ncbi:GatB/YqeY domain-containing protein [Candidatus Curtissbacteria bacterium]|nr:GatB/YqeY domain-containing protein [Candidatus Curtissbacteria bacterium]